MERNLVEEFPLKYLALNPLSRLNENNVRNQNKGMKKLVDRHQIKTCRILFLLMPFKIFKLPIYIIIQTQ